MLGSVDRAKTLTTCDWHGEYAECELCGHARLCTERCDMVTCRECQTTLLPAGGRL